MLQKPINLQSNLIDLEQLLLEEKPITTGKIHLTEERIKVRDLQAQVADLLLDQRHRVENHQLDLAQGRQQTLLIIDHQQDLHQDHQPDRLQDLRHGLILVRQEVWVAEEDNK